MLFMILSLRMYAKQQVFEEEERDRPPMEGGKDARLREEK